MCPPITASAALNAFGTAAFQKALFATSLAISTATRTLQYTGQRQAAHASEHAAAETARRSRENLLRQQQAINRQTIEERAADAQELSQSSIERVQAQSRARAAAASAGTSGQSVDALLADYDRQEATYRNAVLISQGFRETAAEATKSGVRADHLERVAQARSRVVRRPTFLGSALRIGGDAIANRGILKQAPGWRNFNKNGEVRSSVLYGGRQV